MKPSRKIQLLFWLLGSFLLFQPVLSLAAKVTDVRFWSATDHTRVVLDLNEPVQFDTISQEAPPQTVIELRGASLQTQKRQLEPKDLFVIKVILTEVAPDSVKLLLQQQRPLKANVFLLKPHQDKPYRLVVDLVDLVQEKREEEERRRQKEIEPKSKIVVIDPGHGGEDPGAVGPMKTMEKDIVLKVGTQVVQLLNQGKGIQAFLTRKGDYFIPLHTRVKIAREYRADLLISLHTDGSFNPGAKGSSVYCLSLSGATDQAAKILADKENMSDMLGGAIPTPASLSKNPEVNQILFELMQNNSMRESFRFSEILLDDLKKIHRLKYSAYKQANFVVLRAPDIPSVLVEIAYITNKDEEQLLLRPEFQEKFSKTLVSTIQKFLSP